MSTFHSVCRVGDINEGEGLPVEIDGKMIAVILHDGHYYAIDDTCPHMGASLSGGYVADGIVTCPWHAWRFRLNDGAWADSPRVSIGCYMVRVEGDEVQVQVASAEGDT